MNDRNSLTKRRLKITGVSVALAFFAVMSVRLGTLYVYRTGWWNPLIECAHSTIDLESIPANSVHRCEFIVSNGGQRPLRIERIRVGYSACLKVVRFPQVPLDPGERGSIVAEMLTKSMQRLVVRTISAHTNDPTQPSFILKVRADVAPPSQTALHDSEHSQESPAGFTTGT